MPIADMPPRPPVLSAPAPECRVLSYSEAQAAYQRLRQRLPSTEFTGAQPSEVCGLVRVQLARGAVAYTDATGRYLLLALALDTHRGSPADVSATLEQAVDARTSFPQQAIPGLLPPASHGAASKP